MLNEDALKDFISQLPDLDVQHEADALGDDEELYLRGVLDAYSILTGEQPQTIAMIETLHGIAQRFRIQHTPEWVSLGPGRGAYCDTCQVNQGEGDVPWHLPQE